MTSSLNLVARTGSLYLITPRAGWCTSLPPFTAIGCSASAASPNRLSRWIKFHPLLRLNQAGSRLKHKLQTELPMFRTQRWMFWSQHGLPTVPRHALRGCWLSNDELRLRDARSHICLPMRLTALLCAALKPTRPDHFVIQDRDASIRHETTTETVRLSHNSALAWMPNRPQKTVTVLSWHAAQSVVN